MMTTSKEPFEETDDSVGNVDVHITNPFSTKDIKITNALLLLPSLMRRLDLGEIDLNPDFQRYADLWDTNRMSRLIESILLKLPLPVFYFDVTTADKWIVVDGLQRLSTINRFFVKQDLKLKNLEFLTDLNGKKYNDLGRSLQRTIDDTQLITYQIEAQTPKKVRYSIFNRINTGGLSLNAQEIRQALNQEGNGDEKASGVKFLGRVVEEDIFKTVVGISNKRMAGQELVLRFIAFKILEDNKFTIMTEFLDLAMEEIDKKPEEELQQLKGQLIDVLNFSEEVLGKEHKFSRSIADTKRNKLVNKSLFDVLTICLDEIENKTSLINKKELFKEKLIALLKDEASDFFESITKGTSGKKAKDIRFKTIRHLIQEVVNET